MSACNKNDEASTKVCDNIINQTQISNKKTKVDNTRRGSNIRSWIWSYFDPEYRDNIRYAICKVETVKGKKCGREYKVNTSTGNCSSHLSNVYGITEEHDKNKNNTELVNLPHNESRQLQLCQYLADWIIIDSQPLTVLQNLAFRKFVTELDPKFKIPCAKYIKKLVHIAYNHTFKSIMEKDAKKTSTYLRHVIADVSTRWNSSYLAWCRLLELEKYIRILEVELTNDINPDSKKDSQYLTKIMLTNDEWGLLCNLIPVLGPFEEATDTLVLKPTSLSTEEINIETIKDIFAELEICDDESDSTNLENPIQTVGVLEKVKETLYRAMRYYWKKDNIESYLPSILDPRAKNLNFAPDKIRPVQDLLRTKYHDAKNGSP
ncbi:17314_t:CDS:2, partial [Gigaspora margarita]